MKTKFLILLTFICVKVMGQNYNTIYSKRDFNSYKFITVGVDIRNGLVGSNPTDNKGELDVQVKIGAIFKKVEVSLFYEDFHRIKFQAYGVSSNFVQPLSNKFDGAMGIELGSIIRNDKENNLMVGSNLELRYHLSRKIILGTQLNTRLRTDLWEKGMSAPFISSGFLNITYKL